MRPTGSDCSPLLLTQLFESSFKFPIVLHLYEPLSDSFDLFMVLSCGIKNQGLNIILLYTLNIKI